MCGGIVLGLGYVEDIYVDCGIYIYIADYKKEYG